MVLRFPYYSLRTGIVASLTFLILSAMLLINIVMVKFTERDLIDTKVEMGRLIIHAIGQRVGYESINRHEGMIGLASDPRFNYEIAQLLRMGGYSSALMVSSTGAKLFGVGSWGKQEEDALIGLKEALRRQQQLSLEFLGEVWGVIWLAPEMVRMSGPVFFGGRLLGAVAVCADLGPLYQGLRKSERLIIVYICLNAIILVLFGIYLLSRTVVKPIHRLLTVIDKFEEWPPLFDKGEASKNEIGQLFRSLKMMLKRLEANKEELKANISSLEKANLEIKKAQDEIIKSEKMASAGRLATGVAHEIGNPLSIVLGYLELLKRGDLGDEERNDFVVRIESEVTRINRIIRELLDFSRPTIAPHEETGIHQLIMETVKMLEPQPMMDQIEIRQDFGAEKDVVWAGMAQLKQVFVNIIMNAADSMMMEGAPSDGLSPKVLDIETENEDESIVIYFRDTGIGIPPGELCRIFDPFYTTKEPGKGTGLGLSVCYTIIEGLGGTIRAESTPGKGSRIVVKIPLTGNSRIAN
jgi:signal transduction histidine kinase